MDNLDRITGEIIDVSLAIHRHLGPGLLESVYECVLAKSLEQHGFNVRRQARLSFSFQGILFDEGFCVDLLVEEQVIVELKSVEKLAPVHAKQLLTYLRLADKRVGLLINFGAPMLRDGLQRMVNRYSEPAIHQTFEHANALPERQKESRTSASQS